MRRPSSSRTVPNHLWQVSVLAWAQAPQAGFVVSCAGSFFGMCPGQGHHLIKKGKRESQASMAIFGPCKFASSFACPFTGVGDKPRI